MRGVAAQGLFCACALVVTASAADPLPILPGESWTYFKGTAEPSVDWNAPTFDDATWLSGPSGFGYSDSDDATLLADMPGSYLSVYIRHEFDVPDASAVLGMTLFVDYDDGFVAYLNGVEVARAGMTGAPPAYDAEADEDREAGAFDAFVLDADVGLLVDGTNLLAVQAHNVSLNSSDFSIIPKLELANPGPDPPVNAGPADGAVAVPANPLLCVDVTDPHGEPLEVTFHGVDSAAPLAADFTIVALPDTQKAIESFPGVFQSQTEWIVAERAARNIAFTTHFGDCVQDAGDPVEWTLADGILALLEDPVTTSLSEGIPWGMAPGNHDQLPLGAARLGADEGATTTMFNQTFGPSRFAGRSYYGGAYDFGDPVMYGQNGDNSYQLFDSAHYRFLILHLEYDEADNPTRRDVLDWAASVIDAHPDRRVIVTSHWVLDSQGHYSNQGQAIYDRLRGRDRFFLMMGGHAGEGSMRSDTLRGRTVHAMLGNYQSRPNGGDGWLRTLTFSPATDEISIESYSPWLDLWEIGAPHEFLLDYDMDRGLPFESLGDSVVVASGGTACLSWPGRQAGGVYEWYVRVSDGNTTVKGPTWSFRIDCLDDVDCDGVGDAVDCDPANTQAWSRPGESLDLRPVLPEGDFEFDPPLDPGAQTLTYDVLRASDATDFVSDATCVESDDGSDLRFSDPETPATGQIYFYLVRAENDCPGEDGQGSLGADSSGNDRPGVDCSLPDLTD